MSAVEESINAEENQTPAKAAKKAPPVVVTVKMQDGREVEFAGKKKMLKTVVLADDGSLDHVLFDFKNGETRKFFPVESLNGYAMGHGYSQKIGDEAASYEDVDDMTLAIDNMIEQLGSGDWNKVREAGGMAGTSILLKALVEFSGKTKEQIQEFLKNKSKKEKDALRINDKIKSASGVSLKAIVQRLEDEKAAKAASVEGVDDALAELALG